MGNKLKTALVVTVVITGLLKILGCTNMGQRIDSQTRSWFDSHRWSHRILILTGDTEIVNAQLVLFANLNEQLLDRNIVIVNSNENDIFFW